MAPSAIPFGGELTKVPRAMTETDMPGCKMILSPRPNAHWRPALNGWNCTRRMVICSTNFFRRSRTIARTNTAAVLRTASAFCWIPPARCARCGPEKLPLAVRISASDWMEGGWDLEQSIALAQLLKAEGVDLMDCSSGGLVPDAKIEVKPGYQVPFAEKIRQGANIPTAAVGFITEAKQADDIVRNGQADLVLLARRMLVDPYWPAHAAKALGQKDKTPPPPQYLRAW